MLGLFVTFLVEAWQCFHGENVARPSQELGIECPVVHILWAPPADEGLAVVSKGSIGLDRAVVHQVAGESVRLEERRGSLKR